MKKQLLAFLIALQPMQSNAQVEGAFAASRVSSRVWQVMYRLSQVSVGLGATATIGGIAGVWWLNKALKKAQADQDFPKVLKYIKMKKWADRALKVGIPLTTVGSLLLAASYFGGRYHRINDYIRQNKPLTPHAAREIHHFMTHGYLFPKPEWVPYIIAHRDSPHFTDAERCIKPVDEKGDLNYTVEEMEECPLGFDQYQDIIIRVTSNTRRISQHPLIQGMQEKWRNERYWHRHRHPGGSPGKDTDVTINNNQVRLHPKRVYNIYDRYCAAHSMMASLSGRVYSGSELALALAHYSREPGHYIERSLGANAVMPLALYRMIPYVTGRPVFIWQQPDEDRPIQRLYAVLGAVKGQVQMGVKQAIHLLVTPSHIQYAMPNNKHSSSANDHVVRQRLNLWHDRALDRLGSPHYEAASRDMFYMFSLYLRSVRDEAVNLGGASECEHEVWEIFNALPSDHTARVRLQEIQGYLKQLPGVEGEAARAIWHQFS